MRPRRSHWRLPLLLAPLAALWGCAHPVCPAVCSYLSSPAELQHINRVVFLELADQAAQPNVARDVADDVLRALQERRLFRVEPLRETDPRCSAVPVRPDGRFTLVEMKQLREGLECDAVLVGAMTSFQQYPRMQIGLRLTLLDLKAGKVVWSLDNVWDTRDLDVERRIREFFGDRMAHQYEPVDWQIGTVSASAFSKFVAYEVAGTLVPKPAS
jgi:hypothetical protein